MYYYIVDPQKISQRHFDQVQNILYSSVSEYRISGETARVTGLRTINQLVETALARGVKTLVAVGTDETLHEVINAVKGREVIIGFIPLLRTELGEILGLGDIEHSAKTIGLRRVAELDLAQVNSNFFLSNLTFGALPAGPLSGLGYKTLKNLFGMPTFQIKFTADNNDFSATLSAVGGIVVNSRATGSESSQMFNPTDGVLDVVLLPKLNRFRTFRYRREILTGRFEAIPGSSLIHVRQMEITTPAGLPLRVDGKIVARTPAQISVLPQALKIIVGRDRKF
ncbi:MAG: hypothetical protein A3J07_01020 [Candidatus Doudnabacteria bacterium RIFCSPLOWO2_02_FULL_49_13]|uniref:DAGKc domain-containing protein n=1 Tax=Candidatus Doudnabacteria bacterium RIFCSPHIGHO2_12_FULL_48_16 TaxID=1817838 RepID=A0A1F5PK80_9BACT|nr:MAG: hypothetical protein A3B77_03950 [Candidatus Doudnabacteria bacterium RIFCSPHIGHO2_02_FULL_49_24]OGE88641.1 MAG: hypothetical protein A2760_01610 [Candidatus Doudnabacteria bacterium RIFCSPHIGHO2_01_FULL_50_67]OGE90326.1 MAG: hypothetical protein A3E29_04530 [Candidatus Doudnabacteria bacterium RIFCSPHIGHO2_12_FULL_48_16]OGE97033.1 MAG: hypothetical protein A2990_01520 [Candidatus Doudnabacteria bacterium RIFCSPLOWO2_01_FULL_49_40]OGF02382.1 MAG: hypothetical protein A3J07_01020 [Candid